MTRQMQCPWTGKIIYWDERNARIVSKRINKHSSSKHIQKPYRCKKCNYWHLFSKKKREKPDECLPS